MTSKELDKMVRGYANELEKNGFDVFAIEDVELVDTVAFFGQCEKSLSRKICKIKISTLAVKAGRESLRNTILHELCHAMPDSLRHGKQWKTYAKRVSTLYNTEITTKAATDVEKKAYREAKREKAKYMVYCPNCGREWYYMRKSKTVTHPQDYVCGVCKHDLESKPLKTS